MITGSSSHYLHSISSSSEPSRWPGRSQGRSNHRDCSVSDGGGVRPRTTDTGQPDGTNSLSFVRFFGKFIFPGVGHPENARRRELSSWTLDKMLSHFLLLVILMTEVRVLGNTFRTYSDEFLCFPTFILDNSNQLFALSVDDGV